MAQIQRPYPTRKKSKNTRQTILATCVRLFLEQGYTATTLMQITKEAGVSVSSVQNCFGNKDGVLLDLAEIMFSNQFETAKRIGNQEANPLFVYAVETSIQLTLTELNENLRDVYVAAYSNEASAEYIYRQTSKELHKIFLPYNPDYTESDFYECEIGSAGIMRGFMARKCDQYFTLEKKLTKFLTMSLRSYNVPKAEIDKTIAFVLSLDIIGISKLIMQKLFDSLAMQFNFEFSAIEK